MNVIRGKFPPSRFVIHLKDKSSSASASSAAYAVASSVTVPTVGAGRAAIGRSGVAGRHLFADHFQSARFSGSHFTLEIG